jgi:aspartyl-tRNA(Asn)/glutamyl-tRNA(Gln) amidotransferase subunit B
LFYILKLSQSLNCKVSEKIIFDRKNYFYPDLPKGYQITQFFNPTGTNGFLEVIDKSGKWRKIKIREIHLEEDAGKLIHKTENGKNYTIVDYNRASIPLIEIVTEPVFKESGEVKLFLQLLYLIRF